ncbi:unnamed protein product [Phytophthora lilii]|uniref:Unnamed protein product n=1 Tax=Phytophthora lilii TaxID=2077276 RepID=A0A9W6WND4_9STRA|nr:unnamed protein product [Phytophthora lilii]
MLNQSSGQLPVSSSATTMIEGHSGTRDGRKDYVTPRALEISEIPGLITDYKRAAENANAAGFDGVEIHAANGYLLEQFRCDSVNTRTDKYGGSIENRAPLIFEVVKAVLSSLPSSKLAILLSPFGDTFGCKDSNPRKTYGYVVKKLNDYDLAYLHVIERRGMHADNVDVPVGAWRITSAASTRACSPQPLVLTAPTPCRPSRTGWPTSWRSDATSSRTRTSSSVCARTQI